MPKSQRKEEILVSKKYGFMVYERKSRFDAVQVLSDFIIGKIKGKLLNSGNEDRLVTKIEVDGKYYIIKMDAEKENRLEKKITNFFMGNYYSKLFKRTVSAENNGCNLTNKIYLVAEKINQRNSPKTWLVMDYIEGMEFSRVKSKKYYLDELKDTIIALHGYGIASNDLHDNNIILTEEGIKIIDISDRGFLHLCKINDVIALKKNFDIEITMQGFLYWLIKTRNQLRAFKRRLSDDVSLPS